MPSAFLAVLFIFSIHFTENSASDVRMTRYHITSREYKSNINDVPGSYGTRSITDCARHCDANDEECFYYDQELQKCYCNNGTDDEYFTASGSWNGTEVAYGLKTSKKKDMLTTNESTPGVTMSTTSTSGTQGTTMPPPRILQ